MLLLWEGQHNVGLRTTTCPQGFIQQMNELSLFSSKLLIITRNNQSDRHELAWSKGFQEDFSKEVSCTLAECDKCFICDNFMESVVKIEWLINWDKWKSEDATNRSQISKKGKQASKISKEGKVNSNYVICYARGRRGICKQASVTRNWNLQT